MTFITSGWRRRAPTAAEQRLAAYRRLSWSEIREWSTDKELDHAAHAWQMHFWWKGFIAFVWTLLIQAPFIALWMLLR